MAQAAVVVEMVAAAAVVAALPVVATVAVVVVVVAAATSVAAHAHRIPVSHVRILATARRLPANRVRRSRRVIVMIPSLHATAASNSIRTRAARAPNQEASPAMTSTTSNPPATPLQASRRPASRQAATAATSAADVPAAAARVAVVAGATGLVGRAVLARLLADKSYAAVHVVGRRAPEQQHPKLVLQITKSFSDISLPPVDDVFIALGTTIKVAGSASAFRAVDFDAVVAVARAARTAGASRLGVVSSMGSDSQSKVFYNRVKGEMELAVAGLGFDAVVVARPSLLAGNRDALKQPGRVAEKMSLFAINLFKPLVPANYQPVEADDVAKSLVEAVQAAHSGTRVLLSSELHR